MALLLHLDPLGGGLHIGLGVRVVLHPEGELGSGGRGTELYGGGPRREHARLFRWSPMTVRPSRSCSSNGVPHRAGDPAGHRGPLLPTRRRLASHRRCETFVRRAAADWDRPSRMSARVLSRCFGVISLTAGQLPELEPALSGLALALYVSGHLLPSLPAALTRGHDLPGRGLLGDFLQPSEHESTDVTLKLGLVARDRSLKRRAAGRVQTAPTPQ